MSGAVLVVDASDNVLRGLAIAHNNVGMLLDHSTANRIVNGSATDNRFMGVFLDPPPTATRSATTRSRAAC